MKQSVLFSCLFCLFISNFGFSQKIRCGVLTENLNQKTVSDIENQIQNWISGNQHFAQNRDLITIPVVVHIVWNESSQNLTDAQIESQIEALNEDFRALNPEIGGVPGEFQDVIADTEIEFCLALTDPDGNPTNGITRTFTQAPAILGSKNIHYKSTGGADAWDTNHYLNIWVANGGSIAGIGSFPGQDPPEEDGVEIAWENFGTLTVEPPYHLGRTTTHEVGHYFNLFHPWQNDCLDGDMVNDTPISDENYLSKCPTHPSPSCGSNDMFMNFMYWTDDACMAMFTEGQKMRMLATLNGLRSGLLNSNGCFDVNTNAPNKLAEIKIFPNPTSDKIWINFPSNSKKEKFRFEFLNLAGKKINFSINSSLSKYYIETPRLPNGIYFLKISLDDQFITKKIILAK